MAYSRLERAAQYLKGVGPKRAEALKDLGIRTARDLLYHVPRRYDDASTVTPVGELQVGMDATAVGRVRSKGIIPTRSRLRIFQAVLEDETGLITVAWPGRPWLERKIREGDTLLVTGPVKFFHGRQLQPREFTLLRREGQGEDGSEDGGGDEEAAGTIFVTYPASEDVPQWVLRRIFHKNLDALLEWADDDEYLPPASRERLGLSSLPDALRWMHRPPEMEDAERGRSRLAFDELFFLQLLQALVRHTQMETAPGRAHRRTNELVRPLHETLPFTLTNAQARVLREIYEDMGGRRRMNRLVQGDVGSGKTVVALFAMLLALEGGTQAALMAPTELLAEQHARTLRKMVGPLELEVGLLTGSLGAGERRRILKGLGSGELPLVVGTHALIQEGVEFDALGLVVVDEQHRFGVKQRMALAEGRGEGPAPDVLIMSATPIPRSLAMTLYGDLDLSVLDEMPPGRTPVRTSLRTSADREDVYAFVEKELDKGRQAYVVYPLVEESDKVDLRSATQEHQRLQEVFAGRSLGLLHGRLSAEEKEGTMRAFLAGEHELLVATTVIEVGIDVPNASVLVIEHAERFGLSQLHQLRGRVGRGTAASHCILIAEPGDASSERLTVFRDTTDGFAVARADLAIRGQGDLFGAQQHGRDPQLRFADLLTDEDLLIQAQAAARAVVESDPRLEQVAHQGIRGQLEGRYRERLEMFGVG